MIRKIEINAVLNGFVVQVGCTAVVFETADKMLSDLGKYLADPVATEKAYQTESINANKLGLVAAPPRDVIREHRAGLASGVGSAAEAMVRRALDEGVLGQASRPSDLSSSSSGTSSSSSASGGSVSESPQPADL